MGRGVLAVVQEADVTLEALHDMNREVRRLREYVSAANGETVEAKAAAMVALAELASELNFVFFKIHSTCTLILMVLSSRSLPRHPRAIGWRSS